MEKISNTYVSVWVTIVAILAPCLTSLITSYFQNKIEKDKLKDKRMDTYISNYFDTLNNYLSTGNILSEKAGAYFSACQKLYIISDKDTRYIIDQINMFILNANNWNSKQQLIDYVNDDTRQLSINLEKNLNDNKIKNIIQKVCKECKKLKDKICTSKQN